MRHKNYVLVLFVINEYSYSEHSLIIRRVSLSNTYATPLNSTL